MAGHQNNQLTVIEACTYVLQLYSILLNIVINTVSITNNT